MVLNNRVYSKINMKIIFNDSFLGQSLDPKLELNLSKILWEYENLLYCSIETVVNYFLFIKNGINRVFWAGVTGRMLSRK